MAPATRFRSNSPPVIQETIDGETIMVNLDTGSYYWLDPLASYISGAVQAGAPIQELVADMTERVPDDPTSVDREVKGLTARLLDGQLGRPSGGGVQPAASRAEPPALAR